MEQLLSAAPDARSNETALDSVQFGDDIRHLITAPTENSSSFTALLGLPPNQAMELLHSPPDSTFKTSPDGPKLYQPPHHFNADLLTFPANAALNISPETNSNSRAKLMQKTVKGEPADTVSYLINSSQPLASDSTVVDNQRPGAKRKEREKKGRSFSKKSKCDKSEDGEKLPFVHVRARRGQATDNHSLAERARREKINARMKLLQELVPGCSKISGTALVLDEIINHVQSLQRQVEVLSMELSAVNPRIDFNMDSMMAVASGSLMDSNFPAVMMPIMWPEIQENGSRQQYQQQWNSDAVHQPTWGKEDGHSNFMSRENSLLSYVSSANSASLNSNELKWSYEQR